MLLKELGAFILYYFEVSAASIYLGLALMGVRPGIKKILTMGFLVGFVMFLVRYGYSVLNIPLGSHFLFAVISVTLANRYMAHVTWGLSVAGMLIANVITVLSEAIFTPVFLRLSHITIEEMVSTLWLHVLGGYFGNLLILILTLIVSITGFTIIKPDKIQKSDFDEKIFK